MIVISCMALKIVLTAEESRNKKTCGVRLGLRPDYLRSGGVPAFTDFSVYCPRPSPCCPQLPQPQLRPLHHRRGMPECPSCPSQLLQNGACCIASFDLQPGATLSNLAHCCAACLDYILRQLDLVLCALLYVEKAVMGPSFAGPGR